MRSAVIDPVDFSLRLAVLVADFGGPGKAAVACGMPETTLGAYLYQQNLPGTRALAKLARGLDVSLDYLVFGEGRP